ncbi:hypothetical protein KIPB_004215 [Kipferlia bialata]|uniref:Uncharacterized protein n=1 Tax=Kipferlia bialata TaxID=797122 RepID=A0A9K3GGE0_9EUKA|nr:hypothetical protein KIPB_004215 [Kipferlia bialata]|eukprot:g4215.t1
MPFPLPMPKPVALPVSSPLPPVQTRRAVVTTVPYNRASPSVGRGNSRASPSVGRALPMAPLSAASSPLPMPMPMTRKKGSKAKGSRPRPMPSPATLPPVTTVPQVYVAAPLPEYPETTKQTTSYTPTNTSHVSSKTSQCMCVTLAVVLVLLVVSIGLGAVAVLSMSSVLATLAVSDDSAAVEIAQTLTVIPDSECVGIGTPLPSASLEIVKTRDMPHIRLDGDDHCTIQMGSNDESGTFVPAATITNQAQGDLTLEADNGITLDPLGGPVTLAPSGQSVQIGTPSQTRSKSVPSSLSVGGDSSLDGDLLVGGDASVSGDLSVTGALSVGEFVMDSVTVSSLSVSGASTVGSLTSSDGLFSSNGAMYFGDSTDAAAITSSTLSPTLGLYPEGPSSDGFVFAAGSLSHTSGEYTLSPLQTLATVSLSMGDTDAAGHYATLQAGSGSFELLNGSATINVPLVVGTSIDTANTALSLDSSGSALYIGTGTTSSVSIGGVSNNLSLLSNSVSVTGPTTFEASSLTHAGANLVLGDATTATDTYSITRASAASAMGSSDTPGSLTLSGVEDSGRAAGDSQGAVEINPSSQGLLIAHGNTHLLQNLVIGTEGTPVTLSVAASSSSQTDITIAGSAGTGVAGGTVTVVGGASDSTRGGDLVLDAGQGATGFNGDVTVGSNAQVVSLSHSAGHTLVSNTLEVLGEVTAVTILGTEADGLTLGVSGVSDPRVVEGGSTPSAHTVEISTAGVAIASEALISLAVESVSLSLSPESVDILGSLNVPDGITTTDMTISGGTLSATELTVANISADTVSLTSGTTSVVIQDGSIAVTADETVFSSNVVCDTIQSTTDLTLDASGSILIGQSASEVSIGSVGYSVSFADDVEVEGSLTVEADLAAQTLQVRDGVLDVSDRGISMSGPVSMETLDISGDLTINGSINTDQPLLSLPDSSMGRLEITTLASSTLGHITLEASSLEVMDGFAITNGYSERTPNLSLTGDSLDVSGGVTVTGSASVEGEVATSRIHSSEQPLVLEIDTDLSSVTGSLSLSVSASEEGSGLDTLSLAASEGSMLELYADHLYVPTSVEMDSLSVGIGVDPIPSGDDEMLEVFAVTKDLETTSVPLLSALEDTVVVNGCLNTTAFNVGYVQVEGAEVAPVLASTKGETETSQYEYVPLLSALDDTVSVNGSLYAEDTYLYSVSFMYSGDSEDISAKAEGGEELPVVATLYADDGTLSCDGDFLVDGTVYSNEISLESGEDGDYLDLYMGRAQWYLESSLDLEITSDSVLYLTGENVTVSADDSFVVEGDAVFESELYVESLSVGYGVAITESAEIPSVTEGEGVEVTPLLSALDDTVIVNGCLNATSFNVGWVQIATEETDSEEGDGGLELEVLSVTKVEEVTEAEYVPLLVAQDETVEINGTLSAGVTVVDSVSFRDTSSGERLTAKAEGEEEEDTIPLAAANGAIVCDGDFAANEIYTAALWLEESSEYLDVYRNPEAWEVYSSIDLIVSADFDLSLNADSNMSFTAENVTVSADEYFVVETDALMTSIYGTDGARSLDFSLSAEDRTPMMSLNDTAVVVSGDVEVASLLHSSTLSAGAGIPIDTTDLLSEVPLLNVEHSTVDVNGDLNTSTLSVGWVLVEKEEEEPAVLEKGLDMSTKVEVEEVYVPLLSAAEDSVEIQGSLTVSSDIDVPYLSALEAEVEDIYLDTIVLRFGGDVIETRAVEDVSGYSMSATEGSLSCGGDVAVSGQLSADSLSVTDGRSTMDVNASGLSSSSDIYVTSASTISLAGDVVTIAANEEIAVADNTRFGGDITLAGGVLFSDNYPLTFTAGGAGGNVTVALESQRETEAYLNIADDRSLYVSSLNVTVASDLHATSLYTDTITGTAATGVLDLSVTGGTSVMSLNTTAVNIGNLKIDNLLEAQTLQVDVLSSVSEAPLSVSGDVLFTSGEVSVGGDLVVTGDIELATGSMVVGGYYLGAVVASEFYLSHGGSSALRVLEDTTANSWNVTSYEVLGLGSMSQDTWLTSGGTTHVTGMSIELEAESSLSLKGQSLSLTSSSLSLTANSAKLSVLEMPSESATGIDVMLMATDINSVAAGLRLSAEYVTIDSALSVTGKLEAQNIYAEGGITPSICLDGQTSGCDMAFSSGYIYTDLPLQADGGITTMTMEVSNMSTSSVSLPVSGDFTEITFNSPVNLAAGFTSAGLFTDSVVSSSDTLTLTGATYDMSLTTDGVFVKDNTSSSTLMIQRFDDGRTQNWSVYSADYLKLSAASGLTLESASGDITLTSTSVTITGTLSVYGTVASSAESLDLAVAYFVDGQTTETVATLTKDSVCSGLNKMTLEVGDIAGNSMIDVGTLKAHSVSSMFLPGYTSATVGRDTWTTDDTDPLLRVVREYADEGIDGVTSMGLEAEIMCCYGASDTSCTWQSISGEKEQLEWISGPGIYTVDTDSSATWWVDVYGQLSFDYGILEGEPGYYACQPTKPLIFKLNMWDSSSPVGSTVRAIPVVVADD